MRVDTYRLYLTETDAYAHQQQSSMPYGVVAQSSTGIWASIGFNGDDLASKANSAVFLDTNKQANVNCLIR